MQKILIFGSNGGLGSSLVKQLKIDGFEVIEITSKLIDFSHKNSSNKIHNYIDNYKPDIIINSAGILGNNYTEFSKIFNINLKSNWAIANYFIHNKSYNKTVKIIFIGSSSYKQGKKDYILYAASKAALFNLFEGLTKYFENSNIYFGLVNPTRIKTKMVAHLYKDGLRHIHPDPNQARSITVREAARIQTFDDDFEFLGTKGDQYKMIGNAVPPLFSKLIASTIIKIEK